MTTLAISAANFAASTATQAATAYALSAANSLISHAFDNRVFEGPRLESFHVQTSRDGAPMARAYGRVRLAGQVIWASRIREIRTEEEVQSGKGGGPTQTNYSYTISFAIGLCEGEIMGVDRLWANGVPLQSAGLTMRVYLGTADQDADPIISAIEGGNVPAFRNTAYIVFEDFPLDGFGARMPQINAEVIRLPPSQSETPKLETLIKSVNLLPASGEFAYATEIIEETPEPGVSRPINMNNLSGQADIMLSLDQLEDQLPNCRHVSIITAWFGTDLDCGRCEIQPGVESRERILPEATWSVAGQTRGTAYLVSSGAEGRPHFGGTPSDETITQTIQELKRRGFGVTLYPFILMDIPDGPMPFPWRGRISGQEGVSTTSNVASFFNRENGFRNYILHYANLAKAAGGVDCFVIGTEMRGLTTLRGSRVNGISTYPAVKHFVDLARDAKAILGTQTDITYAADWTEYFGHHPDDGSGDVSFHLDPLWASDDVDVIGIDAYFPLSDWREGEHLDEGLSNNIYDLDYLQSKIESGEGFDYYYASEADRTAQIRTAITDGAANKPWVFRYKDLRNWWSNPHNNRVGGVEISNPTAWQASSKPIRFMEIGCPAVHFGANQPNVFYDPKSSESQRPYFSNGARDDLIQRRYLEGLISYWDDTENNPKASAYNGRMIDTEEMSVWAWDSRPFPDFPARESVWSDGANWQTGHWITGRLALIPLADIVRDLAAQSGLMDVDTSGLNGLIQGYTIERPMSARAAITTLSELYGFSLAERAGKVHFFSLGQGDVSDVPLRDLVDEKAGPITHIYPDPAEAIRDIRLHFLDAGTDYQLGSASAMNRAAETERIVDINAPIVMDRSFADYLCDTLLLRLNSQSETARFTFSPHALGYEVGDRLRLPETEGIWRIETIDGDSQRHVTGKRDIAGTIEAQSGANPETLNDIIWPSRPAPIALDLPAPFDGQAVGVLLSPFSETTMSVTGKEVNLLSPIRMGALLSDIPSGPSQYFDRSVSFDIFMSGVTLSSREEADVLQGANRFAVKTPEGWDIIQIAELTLTGPNHYRCGKILRGVGSEGYSREGVSAGARIVWLGAGVETLSLSPDLIGESLEIEAFAAGRENLPSSFSYKAAHLKPLSPVHLQAKQDGTNLYVSWIRRSRLNADSWLGEIPLGEESERYRVRLWSGEVLAEEADVTEPLYFSQQASVTKIEVAQGSDFVGWGSFAELVLS